MKRLIVVLAFCCCVLSASAQHYTPSAEILEAQKEFRDDKFGVFIHWGVYSMLGIDAWAMTDKNINYQEYAKLASGFYPSRFDAAKWVAAVKASGAKYICITSRHHDGFSMFHTATSDYNIVDATPFKRDILRELADECAKQDIRLHFYYSHLDWHRTDYPWGDTGRGTGRLNPAGDMNSYHAFMMNQLTELLTNYGEVGAIWFDGLWDQQKKPDFDWRLDEQYALIHGLQPACLVGNNHHLAPFEGEDIQIFERDLPGENTAGFSAGQPVAQLPLETCETMNGAWGYNITDSVYKSTKTLIHFLVRAAGKDANLLLNVGPQPNGEFPEVAVERMQAIGDWMKVYGETIYGTRGGCVSARPWGVTTQKGDKLYVHILDLKDKALFLPVAGKKVVGATYYKDGAPIRYSQDKEGVWLTLKEIPTETDCVVELTVR